MKRDFKTVSCLIVLLCALASSSELFAQASIPGQITEEFGIPKDTALYKISENEEASSQDPAVCVWKDIWIGRVSSGGIVAKVDLSRKFTDSDSFILYLDADNDESTGRIDEATKGVDYWLACLLDKPQTGTYRALSDGAAVKETLQYKLSGESLYLYSPGTEIPAEEKRIRFSTLCQKGDNPGSPPEAFVRTGLVEAAAPRSK